MDLVIPVRTGWEPLAREDFYPDDLPEDWRLTYFANTLDAVLIPVGSWRYASTEMLEQWSRDVPQGFALFLEDDPRHLTPEVWTGLREALGEPLAGLVSDSGPQRTDRRWCERLFVRDPPDATSGLGLALRVPASLHRDPRGARDWLAATAKTASGRPVLLLLGAVEIEVARQWQMLVDLMGGRRR